MKAFITIVALIAVLALADPTKAKPGRVRRQGWSWGEDYEEPTSKSSSTTSSTTPSTTTTTTTTTATTAATPNDATFQNCMTNCARTLQYNPVCGSNRVTYENEQQLKCARRCGLVVEVVFSGTCSPLRK